MRLLELQNLQPSEWTPTSRIPASAPASTPEIDSESSSTRPLRRPGVIPAGVGQVTGLNPVMAIACRDSDFSTAHAEQLSSLAANRFAPEAQRAYRDFLTRVAEQPHGAARLSEAADTFWNVIRRRQPDLDLSTVTDFYAQHGIQACPNGAHGFQLDYSAYSRKLAAAEAGGVLDRRTMRALLVDLKDVDATQDLKWAHWQITRRVQSGKLRMAPGDTRTRELLDGLTARLDGYVSVREIREAMREARHSGFSPVAMRKVKARLARGHKDDRAMFFAGRALEHELLLAKRDGAALAPGAAAAIDELKSSLGTRLAGKLDQYSEERVLARRRMAGEIDDATYWGSQAAVLTSATPEEYARSLSLFHAQLLAVQIRLYILDAEAEMWRTVNNNMADLDENGRPTQHKLYVELLEREREIKRIIEFEPEQHRYLKVRSWLHSTRECVMTALVGETDPNRRASLSSALAANQAELVDLDLPALARS